MCTPENHVNVQVATDGSSKSTIFYFHFKHVQCLIVCMMTKLPK